MQTEKEPVSKRYCIRIPIELDQRLIEYLDGIKHVKSAQDIMREALSNWLRIQGIHEKKHLK